MNPLLVTLGGLGLIGLVVTVVVVAAMNGAFDSLIDSDGEEEFRE